MSQRIVLEELLSHVEFPEQRVACVALLGLGIVESLTSGSLRATDAVRLFFHADNCLFVRRRLKDKRLDALMGRGVQLPDLFDVLPVEEAERQFRRELTTLRGQCLELIDGSRIAA